MNLIQSPQVESAQDKDQKDVQEPSMSVEELQQAYNAPAHTPEHEKKQQSLLSSVGASIRERISQALPSPQEKMQQLKSAFRSAVLSIPVLKQVITYYESYRARQEELASSSNSSESVSVSSSEEPQEKDINPEELTGKSEATAKAYLRAEEAERAHMDAMEQDFVEIHHQYRKQLVHLHEEVKISNPVLEISTQGENNLQYLAREIAKKQAQQGYVAHTTDEYRKQHGIDDEIIASKFSSAREAFDHFLKSKKDHYKSITGNFSEMAVAMDVGIEEKTGKKTYTVVVLYRNGKPQDSKPPVIDIPGSAHDITIDPETLEGCIAGREHLTRYFEALDTELKDQEGMEYSVQRSETTKLQETPSLKGVFCITLKKGEQQQLYQVFSSPPLLKRVETIGDQQKVFEVPFHQLIDDFSKLNETNTPTAQELQDQFVMSPDGETEPSKTASEEAVQKVDTASENH